jgi:putative transcriptional regulator
MSRILTWLVFAACLLPVAAGADESPARGKLLVATELVRGDVFVQTVILLLHYDETGAMGLVVNRPTEVGMDELVPDDEAISEYSGQIYWGGPVQMNSLLALLQTDSVPEGAERIVDNVYLVSANDALQNALQDEPGLRLFMGYAGWAPGQLDHEMARGSWHVVPASEDSVFAKDPGELWKQLVPQREHRAQGSDELDQVSTSALSSSQLPLSSASRTRCCIAAIASSSSLTIA